MEKNNPGRGRAGEQQEEERATSCSIPAAPPQYVATRSKRANPALLKLALACQSPVDVLPALRRVTRDRLAAAIATGDEAAERLRARLDQLLNYQGAGR
jgi:hypothetical protein